MSDHVILAKGIRKRFTLDSQGAFLARLLRGNAPRSLLALDEVSLEAKKGEVIGIVGGNGSGKSTLLKIIAGIYQPSHGSLVTRGKVIYLASNRQGLEQKLTMRENIFLVGSIMGLSQREIQNHFGDIVALSGLQEFVDVKVHQFSSGMVTRLNFSAMVYSIKHQNPEILLLDEVFGSGGDIDFQQRGIQKMEELIKGGATVVLVSHQLDIMKKYADRVLVLEKGKVIMEGEGAAAVDFYQSREHLKQPPH